MNRSSGTFAPILRTLWGLDVRSLALLRICLAALLLIDLWSRSLNLLAHYSDVGVLPRTLLINEFLDPWEWSVHLISGQTLFQAGLFLVAAIAAIALLIGYRTQLFVVISWILLVSLHHRNGIVLNQGDTVLRVLLFWSMFLPLGAAYSVDSALDQTSNSRPKRILSTASIAFIFQLCFVYWFAALLKDDYVWWDVSSAADYALSLDFMRTRFGEFLLNFPILLTFGTFVTLWIELLGPFLLFVPIKVFVFRLLAITLFCGLHIGFAAGLHLALFPFICMAGWLALIPSEVWNWAGQKNDLKALSKIEIYYDQDCGFCKKVVYLIRTFFILSDATIQPAQTDPDIEQMMSTMNSWVVRGIDQETYIRFNAIAYLAACSPVLKLVAPLLKTPFLLAAGNRFYKWIANHRRQASILTTPLKFQPLHTDLPLFQQVCVLAVLGMVTLWNLNTVDPASVTVPAKAEAAIRGLGLTQEWSMFAAYPRTDDGWYVIPGTLKNGRAVDVYSGNQTVDWENPRSVAATYRGNTHWRQTSYAANRWRQYLESVRADDYTYLRPYYAQYLCRSWNAAHSEAEALVELQINYMLETAWAEHVPPKAKRQELWSQKCSE